MYSGYFYQYINYLDSKYKDLKKEILYKIMYSFDFYDINNIFNQDIIKYQKSR